MVICYIIVPAITNVVSLRYLPFLMTDVPIMIDAIPKINVPIPMEISENPEYCAMMLPEKATMPFESMSPNIFIFPMSIPRDFTIWGLSPTAFRVYPKPVLRKKSKETLKMAAIMMIIINGSKFENILAWLNREYLPYP